MKHSLSRLPRSSRSAVLTTALLFSSWVPAHASLITLTGSSVIGGSGSYQSSFNSGQFQAGNVFDNQSATSIPEPDQNRADSNGGYWLGKEGDARESFVVDLGKSYTVDSFDIFNTHNAFYNDRGTLGFQIYGSNSITSFETGETGAGGFDLVGGVSLVNGSLNYQTQTNDPLLPQSFNSNSALTFRYLRFETTSIAPAVGGFSGGGINELKVYGSPAAVATPEPSTWAMMGMGLMAMIGMGLKRKRSQLELEAVPAV